MTAEIWRLDLLAESRKNNFRIIRHLAAFAVIVGHSFGQLKPAGAPRTDLVNWTGSMADIAVDVFFVASGFLVTRALLRRGNLVDYFLSRALRIYPGLIVLTLLTVFVLGPLVTSLTPAQYFASKSVYGFVFYDCIMVIPNHFRYQLPGVFETIDSDYTGTVNGSLWTLPWELWMYLGLAAAYCLRLLGRLNGVVIAILLLAYGAVAMGLWKPGAQAEIAVRLSAFFYTGVAFYRYRRLVRLSWPVLLAATLLFGASWAVSGRPVLLPLWLGYAVLYAAYYPPLVIERLSEGADYSYGLYIYAYPMQQLLILAHVQSPLLHIAAATALALPLAVLSWHLVEAPALSLKDRLRAYRFSR